MSQPTPYEQRAAEGRRQVSNFFSRVGSFFTPKPGLTDAEMAAKRKAEREATAKQTAAAVARNQADAKARAAANTPTAEEKAFREARNTRIDRLTAEQKRLIAQGRPDTTQQTAAKKAAAAATLESELSPKQEANPRAQQKTTQGAKPKTSSNTGSVNEKPALPQPSDQKQPQLELNVNKNERVRTSGQSISERFDINSFRSEMLFNDVLPSHSYLVTFAPFRTFSGNVNLDFSENIPLTRFVSEKRNTLMMRCENIVLPSPALLEEENIRRYGYGPVEKIPYGVQFGDVTMTWVVDKNSEIIDFFHQWMNTIVMHDSKNASVGPGTTRPGLANYRPFEVGYKDSYANPIVRIYVYNRQQETVTEYEMYDVFPMNIQAMNLSWTDENQIQKLTVTFAYTNMSMSAPQKTSTQFNFYEQVSDAVSPYEHFQAADFFQKSVDIAPSPTGEQVIRTFNASKQSFGLETLVPEKSEAILPLTNSPTIRNV